MSTTKFDKLSSSKKRKKPTSMSRKDAFLLRMLVLVPICLILHHLNVNPKIVFLTAGLAIIPLAAWTANFTEAIASQIGPALGGLLNATFGNATEMIVSIVALNAGLIDVVKASLMGSMIANLLLGLGFALFLGGTRIYPSSTRVNNENLSTVARVNASLLNLVVVFLLAPTAIEVTSMALQIKTTNAFSYIASALLLASYVLMLLFSMKTHSHLYGLDEDAEPESYGSEARGEKYNLKLHIGLLLATTVVLVFVSEVLVDSLGEAIATTGMTGLFTGVILLPIFGAAVEIITCGICGAKNKVDLASSVAIGSSLQIAMFVAPILVFAGLALGKPMNLDFDNFTVLGVGIAVLMTNSVRPNSRSNWLEGMLLLMTYFMLATAFFLHPDMAG
ncbi:calcium/proton antiporter, CaCA family protein [Calothrix sp. NIES-4071]|nr:calcium/proton antiporter, CaCA family protein [Calothrix sp. NIES-4071]BAZ57846.1 calcium/proton antiporter, CaCA family protein [Calothrix sp. NIES-4105]